MTHSRRSSFLTRCAAPAVAAAMAIASWATAQVSVLRTFCPVGGPIPIRIDEPRAEPAPAPPAELPPPIPMELELVRAGTGEIVARGPVQQGQADLASIFPQIWESREQGALYVQLRTEHRRVGAPIVLSPMLASPPYAPRVDRTGAPIFPPTDRRAPVYSGVRAVPLRHLIFETTRGELRFALRPDAAPGTVWFFSQLVEGGLYEGTAFHTIASLRPGAEPDFVQGGDPTGTGKGGAGIMLDLEESPLRHTFGTISMARASDPNSASSQFFICTGGPGSATLDGRYAAFGQLVGVTSAEVLRAIAASPIGPDNRPLDPPRIIRARLEDAPPLGEGPPPAKDPLGEKPER